jgi:hypothetical protein
MKSAPILTELPNLPFVAVLNDQQISYVSGRYRRNARALRSDGQDTLADERVTQ